MSDSPDMIPPPQGQFLVYRTEDGQTRVEVRLEGETAWLTQAHMAELFQTTIPNVSMHLRNVYAEGELQAAATVKEFLIVRQEGTRQVSRMVEHYNLDAIISVGYRVKSAVATRFRIWATQKLREFIVKGFVLDDERLKNPDQPFDYFDELLRRIQDIRTSERRFYQKITDIYATSIDYDPTQPESIEFFQTVQNKLHWAITGQTAAEIIHARADAAKPNMGLTNWRGVKVRKDDVAIAKNYLDVGELAALNNLVEQYLVFAEGQAMRRVPMHMRDRGTAKRGAWVACKTGKRKRRVARPARAMLTRFGEATLPMAEHAHTLHRQIHNRRRTRDLLLPRLLSGQLHLEGGNG